MAEGRKTPTKTKAGALNKKERAFVAAYLGAARYNATQAAIQAGYSEKTAGSAGWRLLKKVEVKDEIERLVQERAMGWHELISDLGDQARLDMGAYVQTFTTPDGSTDWRIDLDRFIADGHGRFIKSITPTQYGSKVEFHDAMTARKMIAQILEKAGAPSGSAEDPIHHVDMSLDEWRSQQARHRQQAAAAVADFAEDDDDAEEGASG